MYPENEFQHHRTAIQQLLQRYEAQFKTGQDAYFEEAAYLKIISYFEADRQQSKALEATERGMDQHPSSINLLLKSAQLLIDNMSVECAFPYLDKARAMSPGEIEVELLYAEALIVDERAEDGFRILDFLKEEANDEEMSSILLVESLAYEQEESYERMFYTLKQALLKDPANQGALERMGICVVQSKKFEESIDLHEALLAEDAYLALAWYNLAQARVYTGDYERAIEAYDFAFTIEEDFLQACRDCADLCLELQQFNRALNYYLELLEQEGADADSDLYIQIGHCNLRLDRPQTAVTFYIRAAQLDPLNDEIFFSIGECYAAEGQWMNAIQYFEKAIEVEDEREEYYAALGEAYFNMGNTEMAIEHLEEAIALNDLEARYWILLATFLMDSGQAELAMEVLETGIETVPGAEILYCRIACLFAIGQRNAALYWLGEALQEDYGMYPSLFELMPDLQVDTEVMAMIKNYAI
ncbi:MAG: tetratricopeptide repeat protein [Phaeodactylibacter sp.]|uniref:tetratricopeptide repeat protein n=1 Tax=Phaeodactylibacter sp. TaxID=1940289 RepID=UPI0032EAB642